MATHAGVALELGITRPSGGPGGLKMMSPQMEAILIWCQCRVRNYKVNWLALCLFTFIAMKWPILYMPIFESGYGLGK